MFQLNVECFPFSLHKGAVIQKTLLLLSTILFLTLYTEVMKYKTAVQQNQQHKKLLKNGKDEKRYVDNQTGS